MKHLGNITVTEANALDFPAVSEIYGHLTISSGAHLVAPDLVAVRGWVTLQPGAKLTVPVLGSINGWLTLLSRSLFTAPHLTEVTADMVFDDNDLMLPELLTAGSLFVKRGINNLRNLSALTGNLTLGIEARLEVPRLTSVGK